MTNIIEFSKYKIQKKNKITFTKPNEEDIANQVLDSLNYNNRNIDIPIIKIAKSYGLGVYCVCFPENEKLSVAGKLFIGGTTKQLYNYNQVILVNCKDPLFEQRIVVARMLGCYLIDMINKNHYNNQRFLLSDTLDYEKIYDKYEEFILNILSPTQIFVRQYNIAVNNGLPRMGVYMYLSRYFEVSDEFVQRKIRSLTK